MSFKFTLRVTNRNADDACLECGGYGDECVCAIEITPMSTTCYTCAVVVPHVFDAAEPWVCDNCKELYL